MFYARTVSKYCQRIENDLPSGSVAWTNPTYAYYDPDGTGATGVYTAGQTGRFLRCFYDWDYATIPHDATITKITVTPTLKLNSGDIELVNSRLFYPPTGSWSSGTDLYASSQPAITNTSFEEYPITDGSTWGLPTCTPAIVTDATFGSQMRLRNPLAGTGGTIEVDSVMMTIEFSAKPQQIHATVEDSSIGLKRVVVTWKADADGRVHGIFDGRKLPKLQGVWDRIITIPETYVANQYDIAFRDRQGVDVVQSLLTERSETELEVEYVSDLLRQTVKTKSNDVLEMNISNAGASATGQVIIYLLASHTPVQL